MSQPAQRISATYLVRCAPTDAEARADAIRVEQSVEMPLAGIRDSGILDNIVGKVESITPSVSSTGTNTFRITIGLAAQTTTPGIAQMINMLFGNTSLHEDVELLDVGFPDEVLAAYHGPRHGIAGLRQLTGIAAGPITCTALKPQGLAVPELAALARTFALSGLHLIKDDHGIANQAYAPFEARVRACQAAVVRANHESGLSALYAPTLSGTPSELFAQARLIREEGVRAVLISPMVIGLPVFQELVADHLDAAVLAHPAMGGAARIAPELLFGKIFRMLGADAVIFTGYGGRFAWSRERCLAIAQTCRAPFGSIKAGPFRPAMPVPAGGMKLERVDELVDFYGTDTMLLIGGDLLIAGDRLLARGREFAAKVAGHARARAA